MRAALAAALLAFATPSSSAQFSFGAFGDMPYNMAEEPQLVSIIAEMNHQPLAFALHVGDFKDARTECSDAVFRERRETFSLSHHPFFYTPGDNEWTDCGRARYAPHKPLERMDKLRQIFFSRDTSLGQRALPVQRQSERGFPENQRWFVENVAFATLNIPGPDNNVSRLPEESRKRTPALLDWMRQTFAIARAKKLPAVVIATQANLWSGSGGYSGILAALATEAKTYDGEVLVVHGDTHWFTFDKPLVDPDSGRAIENVTRLEVHGSPFINWSYVTVTTGKGKAKFEVKLGSEITAGRR